MNRVGSKWNWDAKNGANNYWPFKKEGYIVLSLDGKNCVTIECSPKANRTGRTQISLGDLEKYFVSVGIKRNLPSWF